jgi:hypothetical protein
MRSDRRYSFTAELVYELTESRSVVERGRGVTLNLSSRGVFFRSDRVLRPGLKIELFVLWPATSDKTANLKLWIIGRTVRVQGNCTAVKTLRYRFRRTASLMEVDSKGAVVLGRRMEAAG